MATVTINGHTYTDDASPTTGLGGGGHRARFIPLISDVVTVLGTVAANGSLTINRALASNASGQVVASSVTSTELGYLSGVTSALQTQINAKAPLASPALTGTATAAKMLIGTTTDNASGSKLQVTGNSTITGYSKLGESAPSIKVKKFTGITAEIQGSAVNVAHGLTSTKIIGIQALVNQIEGSGILSAHAGYPGLQFDVTFNGTNIFLMNHPTNSQNILSKPFIVLVIYEE